MGYIILAFGAQVFAQPRIEFPIGSEHDFGDVYKGKTVVHIYLIKNGGTSTLHITDVIPGCGCTVAHLTQSDVPPDSTVELVVSFASGMFVGHTHKEVAIMSNDVEHPETRISIVSNVVPVLDFEPGNMQFNVEGKTLKTYKASVKIKNHTDEDIKILSTDVKVGGLEVKLSDNMIKAGGMVTLYGSMKAKGFGYQGIAGGDVIFKTDFQSQPEQNLRVNIVSKN